MASVNRVTLLGRLGRDPKTSDAQGLAICRLALATTRRYKGRDGKEETEWHNVVVFGKTAEVAQQYLVKGSEVYIEGRLHTRKYTDKQGVERYATEVICESLQLGAKPQGTVPAASTTTAQYAAAKGRDLPRNTASAANEDVPF
jgi:single-strand DNA-binding protein